MLGRYIDLGNPVSDHPDNDGLHLWMLPFAPFVRGAKVFNGTLKGNDGTLNGFPAGGGKRWVDARLHKVALFTDGTNDEADFGTIPGLNASTAATLSFTINKTSNSVTAGLGGCGGDAENRFSCIWWTDGFLYITAEDAGGITYGTVTLTLGERHMFIRYNGAGATNAARLRAWVDGSEVSLSYVGTIPAALGTVNPFFVGKDSTTRWAGGTGSYVGNVRLSPTRALPPEAAPRDFYYSRKSPAEDPRVRTFSRKLYFFGSADAGGGATTMPANGGVYTLTGQAAALRAGRKTAAESGPYTLTGQAATLRRGYPIAAASGSYTLTGQATTLLIAHRTTANSGSYVLTGQVVGLAHGYRITAVSGAYTLTGQDVAFVVGGNPVMAANSGAYTLTGQTAGLVHGYKVAANSGAYTVTGQNAALLHASSIVANVGSYALSGQNAGLSHGFRVGAGTGVYTFAGNAVALVAGRRVQALSGSYTLTGQNVTFVDTSEALPPDTWFLLVLSPTFPALAGSWALRLQ